MNNPPKFVKMIYGQNQRGSAALRLRSFAGSKHYYRDAGNWQCGYKVVEGKMFSVSHIESINGMELVEITKEQWREDNGKYAKGVKV